MLTQPPPLVPCSQFLCKQPNKIKLFFAGDKIQHKRFMNKKIEVEKYKSTSAVQLPSCGGIAPMSKLWCKSNTVRWLAVPKVGGINPVNMLLLRSKYTRNGRLPISFGIAEENAFPERFSATMFAHWPSCGKMGPSSLFWDKSRNWRNGQLFPEPMIGLMLPVSKFPASAKNCTLRERSSGGMAFVSWLWLRSKLRRRVHRPSAAGMVPSRRFPERSRTWSTWSWPSDGGTTPVNWLLAKSSTCNNQWISAWMRYSAARLVPDEEQYHFSEMSNQSYRQCTELYSCGNFCGNLP